MQQLLSIITINYNDFSGLKKTVESVIKQTYSNFEYVVIDGGSTDESYKYLQEKKDSFSHLVSEKDAGIYNAMNKGIRAAKGEYLLFLNSGDVLNGVSALKDFIESPLFLGDIVYGDYKFLEGEKKYPDNLTPLHFFKSSLPHQSSLIKKELFDIYGYYDEGFKIVSDKAFYIKCFLSNKVVFTHINQKLSIVDLNGISNSSEYQKKVVEENNIILKNYFGVFYEDYKNMIKLSAKYKTLESKTFKSLIRRLKKKLFK
ncbi:glycosyltransferase [Polaribacter pectinis]|uniref:Glycosyltransferase n=1 Tax=Polaribacter pectinis TaxID=2738844 RepID=A0A7G9LCA9_9FLAO|nr:glycosyltransferase family 2 protein [Polaribacter pectinis]QNM86258.1 glycosyltransferase [Polaribacter pectinis]